MAANGTKVNYPPDVMALKFSVLFNIINIFNVVLSCIYDIKIKRK